MKQVFDIEFRQLQLEPYQFLQLIFIQQAVSAQGSQVWKKRLQNEYIICHLATSGCHFHFQASWYLKGA